jgi:argininosuccinate lyase
VANVAMRDSRGGPAPDAVETHLDRARDDLAGHRGALGDRRQQVEAAQQRLDEEVATYE